MMDIRDKRILITGAAGFLGRVLVRRLKERGCQTILTPSITEYDLTGEAAVGAMYRDLRPEVVIHLAALVGGIGANMENPGSFFYANAKMGIELMEQGRLNHVEKFVQVGTICAYPKFTPVPFKEENIWDGYPEETNAPYGLAKKMLLVQAQAYRQQYGFNAIYLLPVNLYGPGDNFDPGSSHVIPALIRKCVEAKREGKSGIEVWGTGTASREFLYVEDAAEGIILATERYDKPEPVNLGAGREITIGDLVKTIVRLTSFQGDIVFDPTKPDGQPRRCLDTTRAKVEFGFAAQTDFEDGLRETIDYFEQAFPAA